VYNEAATKGMPLPGDETTLAESDVHVMDLEGFSYAAFSVRMGSGGKVHYNLNEYGAYTDDRKPESDEKVREKVGEWGVPAEAFDGEPDAERVSQGTLDDPGATNFYNSLLGLNYSHYKNYGKK
jgi:hypothetical protein